MRTWIYLWTTALVMAGCTGNTIELEDDAGPGPAASGDDPTTGGDPSGGVTTAGTDPVPGTSVGPSEDVSDDGVPEPGTAIPYLLAIDTPLAPGLPLQALVTVTPADPVPGGNVADLTLQWLSLDQGSTTAPRIPTGDIYSYPGIVLDPVDGSFTWPLGVLLVPADANPITGSDIVASVELSAVVMDNLICGRAQGEVMTPIRAPLEGSTHAMTLITGVDALPLDFAVACP